MQKVINQQLAKLKKGDFFRFEGKKKTYVINRRYSNNIEYYDFEDISNFHEISKFTSRKINLDFEF